MEIRKLPAELKLDSDVSEGLKRVEEQGETMRDVANQVLRDYLKQRGLLPPPDTQ